MTTKEKILEEIKDINYAYNDCSKYNTIKDLLDEMEEGREERKKGKWRHYEGMYICEICHSQFYDISPFCPMCGADMREEKEDG